MKNKQLYCSRKTKKLPTVTEILARQYKQQIKKMTQKENYSG